MAAVVVRPCSVEDRCLVAPDPQIWRQLREQYNHLKHTSPDSPELASLRSVLRPSTRPELNDGKVRPGSAYGPALKKGDINVIVVMVDFKDTKFSKEQTKQHYERLWFRPDSSNSVKSYFKDVSHGAVDIKGDVVGPLTLSETLSYYANGDYGRGMKAPNGRTMAKEAAILAHRGKDVQFNKYVHGDKYVDAFVIVHAGHGAEQTGSKTDIWSHKHTLEEEFVADGAKVFSYLTVPADCKLGVCAHELGHLAFQWPDLYDVDNSSSGIGKWCLMAQGSHNGEGDHPSSPSAWCKFKMGWVKVTTPTTTTEFKLGDVKVSHEVLKLWKHGKPNSEFFLVENRQKNGRDSHIPSGGLLLWHIDESILNNKNEQRLMVGLVQSDAEKDLEHKQGGGDAGDPFPGTKNRREVDHNIIVNGQPRASTLAYNGASSGVAIRKISNPAEFMTFTVSV